MERARLIAACAAALALAPASARAGAWTKAGGAYYTKLGADFYKPEAYVDPATGEDTGQDYFGQQYSLYGEVGVLPFHPVQVSVLLPLSVGTSWFDPGYAADGPGRATTARLGDLRVGVQVALLRTAFQLGVGGEVKVPLYRNDGIGAGYGEYQAAVPVADDGQVDVTGLVVLGGSLPRTPLWMEGAVGYRHRTEAFHGWDVDLEFGDGLVYRYTVGAAVKRAHLMLHVDGVKAFRSDDVTREHLALGPAVLVTVWKGLGLEARFQGEVWTRNAPRGVSFGFGVSWRKP